MRFDILQELSRYRETAPGVAMPDERSVAKEPEPHPILRRLQALAERAGQYRLNHEPPRSSHSAPPRQGREVPAHRHKVGDPREISDPRRTQRNRIPSQTIGLQLRPEERRSMLELGRFRVVRTVDLANTTYDGKVRKLQGCTLVVSQYAGIAVFHGLIMALTFDPCKPLKTRGGGRGSRLTHCVPKPAVN